jgi:energy-coupling factor transporter ATP-binding protein EcfA2
MKNDAPFFINDLGSTVIVTGHYGSGKTNLCLNLALLLRESGRGVTLADLDVVNPYFRTADFKAIAEQNGVHLITPGFAGSSLDLPALTGELDASLGGKNTVIIDVGGDDDGAHALGRYAPRIRQGPYDMLFVASFFRYLTRTPKEALAVLSAIEAASRLEITGIVNASNLGPSTVREDIEASLSRAEELAAISGKPLLFTAAGRNIAGAITGGGNILPVDIYVKAPWAGNG